MQVGTTWCVLFLGGIPSIITEFLSLELVPPSRKHLYATVLDKDCIKFQLPEETPGSLTLIDAFSHFELYINNVPSDIRSRLCPSIWRTLLEGIQKAAETLKYGELAPKQAFLCKKGNTQPHLAFPAGAANYWKCELHPDIFGPLTDEHKVWKGNIGLIHSFTFTVPTNLLIFIYL